MPALVSDIARAIRSARIEETSSAPIKARYPNARDGQSSPAEGFFDTAANGATAIAARAALFGVERRRFTASAEGLAWPNPLTGIPIVRLIDPEQKVDANHICARIELDLEAETSSYEVFG